MGGAVGLTGDRVTGPSSAPFEQRIHPEPNAAGSGSPGADSGTEPRADQTDPTDVIGLATDAVRTIAASDHSRWTRNQALTLIDDLDQLRAATDTALIAAMTELLERGDLPATGHGLIDWLATHSPSISRAHAIDLSRVAQAAAGQLGRTGTALTDVTASADRVAHEPIIEAVTSGALPIRRASMILNALTRIRPTLTDATYAEDVGLVLDAAVRRQTFTERDLTRITDHLVATAMSRADHARRDNQARAVRGINESSLAGGSLTRFIITAEPEGAALLRTVLASPLAALGTGTGGPHAEGGNDGSAHDHQHIDTRTAAARRYDALMAILGRGIASPEGQPTTAKAQLTVTVPYDVLAGELAAARGERSADPFGAGITPTGDLLSPATIRKIACDADIIPAILGTNSEILDLGRAFRLATPAQRRALAHRDQHCTFPGCTIPSGWCEAHHLVHWAEGGPSDLNNYALLCPRHHTYVHTHRLAAQIDPAAPPGSAVTWNTRQSSPAPPGRRPLPSAPRSRPRPHQRQ